MKGVSGSVMVVVVVGVDIRWWVFWSFVRSWVLDSDVARALVC
jgi:hypothetical protein